MTEPTVPQLSQRALLASDEVVRIGLDEFFAKYPPTGSAGFLVPLGTTQVPAQSAAAAMGLNPLNLTNDASRRRSELKMLEHGLRMMPTAVYSPPQIGETHPHRTSIKIRYGGDLISGIVKFPGDTIVNCFADESGAYADDPPTRDAPFGYRGDGLQGNQKLTSPGNKRLEAARLEHAAVRFWHKPRGGQFTFEMWCMVVHRHWGWGIDTGGENRQEVVWTLSAIDGPDVGLPEDLIDSSALDPVADMDNAVGPEAQANPTYLDLVDRLETRPEVVHVKNRVRRDPARSLAARRAVLIRAGEECESPWCTGMPADRSVTDEPLFEVDHVEDLALKGADHPANMVALCPNCHAAKTRGSRAEERRRQLKKIANEKHAAAMKRNPRAAQ
ncbi:HNH endonuclease [Promicromonospora sukumoe]